MPVFRFCQGDDYVNFPGVIYLYDTFYTLIRITRTHLNYETLHLAELL